METGETFVRVVLMRKGFTKESIDSLLFDYSPVEVMDLPHEVLEVYSKETKC